MSACLFTISSKELRELGVRSLEYRLRELKEFLSKIDGESLRPNTFESDRFVGYSDSVGLIQFELAKRRWGTTAPGFREHDHVTCAAMDFVHYIIDEACKKK